MLCSPFSPIISQTLGLVFQVPILTLSILSPSLGIHQYLGLDWHFLFSAGFICLDSWSSMWTTTLSMLTDFIISRHSLLCKASTCFLDLLSDTCFICFQGTIIWSLHHILRIVKWFPLEWWNMPVTISFLSPRNPFWLSRLFNSILIMNYYFIPV